MLDWKTEDETDWEDISPQPLQTKRQRWHWRWMLLALGMVVLALFISYRLVVGQVEQTTTAIEADVIATHQLIAQAQKQGDVELLNYNLSGRDPEWANAMRNLTANGWGVDRPAFGLIAEGEAVVDGVWLSPELTMAVVTVTQAYVGENSNGGTTPIQLTHTETYRRGTDRWLLANANQTVGFGFYDTTSYKQPHLTTIFPQKEGAEMSKLSETLGTQINHLCQTELECPSGFGINITFTPNIESLIAFDIPLFPLTTRNILVLPTFSVIGYPQSEQDAEVLTALYSKYVITAAVNTLADYECCEHPIFYKAVLDMQLAELGLLPPINNPAPYDHIWQYTIPFNGLVYDQISLWDEPLPSPDVYLPHYDPMPLLQFARAQNPDASLVHWMSQLSKRDNLQQWLRDMGLTISNNESSIYSEWFAFVRERAEMPALSPPIPLPTQDLAFLCDSSLNSRNRNYLFQADLTNGDFQEFIYQGLSFQSLLPAPDGKGILAIHAPFTDLLTRFWQNEFTSLDIINDDWYLRNQFRDSPFLVTIKMGGGLVGTPHLLDLDSCDAGECRHSPLSGYPIWSPDQQYTLIYQDTLPPSYAIGNHRAEIIYQITDETTLSSRTIQWAGNDTLYHLPAQTDPNDLPLFRYDIHDRTTTQIANLATLQWHNGYRPPADSVLYGIHLSPTYPNQLFAVFTNPMNGETTLIYYNLTTGRAEQMLNHWSERTTPIISLNGRWFSFAYTPVESSTQLLFLYDLVNEVSRILHLSQVNNLHRQDNHHLWSPDNQWLVLPGNYSWELFNPEHNYTHKLVHGMTDCHSPVWIEGNSQ